MVVHCELKSYRAALVFLCPESCGMAATTATAAVHWWVL